MGDLSDIVKAEMAILGIRPALFSDYRQVEDSYDIDSDPIMYLTFKERNGKKQHVKGIGEIVRTNTNIGVMSVIRTGKDVAELAKDGGLYIYYIPYIHRFSTELMSHLISNNGGRYDIEMDDFGFFTARIKMPQFDDFLVGEKSKSIPTALISAASKKKFTQKENRLFLQYTAFKSEHSIIRYFLS